VKTEEAKLETDGPVWNLLPQRAAREESEPRALCEKVLANIQYQRELESRLAG
jgi:hypothetical protein